MESPKNLYIANIYFQAAGYANKINDKIPAFIPQMESFFITEEKYNLAETYQSIHTILDMYTFICIWTKIFWNADCFAFLRERGKKWIINPNSFHICFT